MSTTSVAALFAAVFIVSVSAQSYLYTPDVPKQVFLAQVLAEGTNDEYAPADFPLTDPKVAVPADCANTPQQISLTFQNSTSVTVNWVVGCFQLRNNTASAPVPAGSPIVMYGATASLGNVATSYKVNTYEQNYWFVNPAAKYFNYTSGACIHVTIAGLMPSQTYYYQVGDMSKKMSAVFSFKMPPGPGKFPFRLGMMADMGQTQNTSANLDHMLSLKPDMTYAIGDFTYADTYNPAGDYGVSLGAMGFRTTGGPTYQPRWDSFSNLISPLWRTIPTLHCHGNHEIEPQVGGKWKSYTARYASALPYAQSESSTWKWYSSNAGPLHLITLSSFDDWTIGSEQYMWLVRDLESVDRSITPWVIVFFHSPWYSTYQVHYKEVECFRLAMEPLLYQYGVDMALSGHIHAYERFNRVYNYQLDACAPIYITIGDSGNTERLYKTFADNSLNCPNATVGGVFSPGCICPAATPAASRLPYYAPHIPAECEGNTFQDIDIGLDGKKSFCHTGQPVISAFREPAYGIGTFDFLNENTVTWTWHRAQDDFSTVKDSVTLTRASNCANHKIDPQQPAKCTTKVIKDKKTKKVSFACECMSKGLLVTVGKGACQAATSLPVPPVGPTNDLLG